MQSVLNPVLDPTLDLIKRTAVTVFGDFCLDAYWHLDESEPESSIETGLPVRRVRQQRYSLGGAGNVAANLIDLGVREVRAVGAVGADLFGSKVNSLLRQRGAEVSGLLDFGEAWQTMVYAKPMRSDGEESRFDFGAFNTFGGDGIDRLLDALTTATASSDVIIFNQQVPGGLSSPAVIERLNSLIAANPSKKFIVDARHHPGLYRGAILKLNVREASALAGEPESPLVSEKQVSAIARSLFLRTRRPVFITRGENGILVADESGVQTVRGIQIIEAIDPVGAGDTVVAALAGVLGSGGDVLTAATIANLAASVTVRKLHMTGTATPAEIRAASVEVDSIYTPELAEDPRQARYVPGTEIEIADALPANLKIKHAIFDHDGTLSTLRQGWEQIMEPMMCRAVLGEQFASVEPAMYRRVLGTVRDLIDKTTGIQTLVQMKGLVQLVKQFGCVPADQILDEHGYKAVYNEALLEMVRGRTQKLANGELDSIDFQIKNARQLLDALHSRGIKLYLASGTDEQDVIAEAEAMGYAHLFEGRIFGAVGDVKVEAKKIVLERIIRENRLSGHEFMTFGDGPVEIRETRKRGGICVGVASDELRRFGLNLSKRTRLIRAGATLIVPDFSQLPALLSALQLQS